MNTCDDEYIQINAGHFIILCLLTAHCLLYYWGYLVDQFPLYHDFIAMNWTYIQSAIDVFILFIFAVAIPLVLYICYVIISVIRFFWCSYSNAKVRASFSIFRFIFSSFVFITLIAMRIWGFPFLSYPVIIIFVLVLVLSYFIIDYEKMISQEEASTNETDLGVITTSNGSLLLYIPIMFFVIIGGSIYLFGEPDAELKILIESFLVIVNSNTILLICFWSATALSILYPIMSILSKTLVWIIAKFKDKIKGWMIMVYIFLMLYFIIKIAIWNLTKYNLLPEPYPTILSLSLSTFGGIASRSSSSLIGWRERMRERFRLGH
jgi:hypothetical protein